MTEHTEHTDLDESALNLDWEYNSALIRAEANALLSNHFGVRCEAYEPTCPLCKKWSQLDALLENPYFDNTGKI